MKQLNLIFLLTMLMSMTCLNAIAYDIAAVNEDGITIYYDYINDGKELEVTFKTNNGDINGYEDITTLRIPSEVTFMNRTRKVTSIASSVFHPVRYKYNIILTQDY